jgi:hypothetical protein
MSRELIKYYQNLKKTSRGVNLSALETKVLAELKISIAQFHNQFEISEVHVELFNTLVSLEHIDHIENYMDMIEKINQQCLTIFEQKIPLNTIEETATIYLNKKLDLSSFDKIKFLHNKLQQLIIAHRHHSVYARLHNLDDYFDNHVYLSILFSNVIKSVDIATLPISILDRKMLAVYTPGKEVMIMSKIESYFKNKNHYFSEEELKTKTIALLHRRSKLYQSLDGFFGIFFPILMIVAFMLLQIILFNEFLFSQANLQATILFLYGLIAVNLNLLFFHLLQRERLTSYNSRILPLVLVSIYALSYGFFASSIDSTSGIIKGTLLLLTLIPTSIYSFALRSKHHRFFHSIYIFVFAAILVFLFYRFSLWQVPLFVILALASQYGMNIVYKRFI